MIPHIFGKMGRDVDEREFCKRPFGIFGAERDGSTGIGGNDRVTSSFNADHRDGDYRLGDHRIPAADLYASYDRQYQDSGYI